MNIYTGDALEILRTLPAESVHCCVTSPPELPRLCILAGCPEGGTVLDPFSGAGNVHAKSQVQRPRPFKASYSDRSAAPKIEEIPPFGISKMRSFGGVYASLSGRLKFRFCAAEQWRAADLEKGRVEFYGGCQESWPPFLAPENGRSATIKGFRHDTASIRN